MDSSGILLNKVEYDGGQHRDGNTVLSEYVPNFEAWDESLVEAFRCVVDAVNSLRHGRPVRNTGTSRAFSLNLDWDEWDDDVADVLSQVEHAIEQFRAAIEDGESFPSAGFLFNFDKPEIDDDLIFFARRIQFELNGLWEGQSRGAIDSKQMLFDLSKTLNQDRKISTLQSKSEEAPCRENEWSWQSLVIAARDSGEHGKAVELAELAVREYPRSDWLWRALGNELTKVDRLDEAKNALSTARDLNPNSVWLWRHFADLHQKRANLEGEIESLETLCSLGLETCSDLLRLGRAHDNYGNLEKAVMYYRLAVAAKPSAALWVILALAFDDSELSQNIDAADAYRCALALEPNHERAKQLLEAAKRKLLPFVAQAMNAASGLVEPDEFFDFYINPLEILQVSDITAAKALDAKAIQQAKKRLLHELELNDGKVSWLYDHFIDKARAVAVVDELDDETKRRYHLAFYRNDRLLNFLTRGDIEHFLFHEDYFPCDTEELLHREPGFRKFLSKPFAKQYNRVLTRAIDKRRLPVVKVLFHGRRWVEPEDADQCFAGAYKRFGEVVEELRAIVKDCSSRKISLREIEDFLRKHSLPELFNLLPVHFASYQRDVVAGIRSLAISCLKTHCDSILSSNILSLCKGFTMRDVALNKQLQDDLKAIEAIVSADRTKKTSNTTQQVTSKATKIWFYISNGNERGPFDAVCMIQLARSGVITPSTMVRCNGSDYSEARLIGFLATVFENATRVIARRPATQVASKPEPKITTVVPPEASDASTSFIWHLSRLVDWLPLVALIACVSFPLAFGSRASRNTSQNSPPSTPLVSSADPVRTPTVPPPNLLPAVPLPVNGTIRRYGFSEGVAPLTIATRTGGGHYFVRLRTAGTRELIAEVLVREGQQTNIKIPLGTYELTYATGRTWYGRKGSFFGPETRYTKADDTFTFRIEGDQVIGYTVELYPQSHGNLETEPISAREF